VLDAIIWDQFPQADRRKLRELAHSEAFERLIDLLVSYRDTQAQIVADLLIEAATEMPCGNALEMQGLNAAIENAAQYEVTKNKLLQIRSEILESSQNQ